MNQVLINIRQGALEDCVRCYELSKIDELKTASGSYIPLDWLESFVKEGQMFLVAKFNNEVIGYLTGERTTGDVAELCLIVVKPEYRGKGIGRMLVKAFEEEVLRRNLDYIVLYAPTFNEKTLKFYESLGYERGEEYVEFSKELKR